MLLVLGFLVLCMAIASVLVLASAQFAVWRLGSSVFQTHKALSIPCQACNLLLPGLTVFMLVWLLFALGLSWFQAGSLAGVGALWVVVMRSRAGFVFILFHVCLVGRLNLGATARFDDVLRDAGSPTS